MTLEESDVLLLLLRAKWWWWWCRWWCWRTTSVVEESICNGSAWRWAHTTGSPAGPVRSVHSCKANGRRVGRARSIPSVIGDHPDFHGRGGPPTRAARRDRFFNQCLARLWRAGEIASGAHASVLRYFLSDRRRLVVRHSSHACMHPRLFASDQCNQSALTHPSFYSAVCTYAQQFCYKLSFNQKLSHSQLEVKTEIGP